MRHRYRRGEAGVWETPLTRARCSLPKLPQTYKTLASEQPRPKALTPLRFQLAAQLIGALALPLRPSPLLVRPLAFTREVLALGALRRLRYLQAAL